jgi:hypothetical protein
MIQRHLSLPHNFICFTENKTGISGDIQIRDLPKSNLNGWWYKPYFFKKDLFPEGDINFFIDLDMVIVGSINKLFDYMPNEFLGLQDPSRIFRPEPKKLGSAVMRWISGRYNNTWDKLEKNNSLIINYKGDQDYIWDVNKDEINYYPQKWILSYKWEVRNRSELTNDRPRRFTSIRNPDIDPETCILAFHGYPKLHTVNDPVILNNWL